MENPSTFLEEFSNIQASVTGRLEAASPTIDLDSGLINQILALYDEESEQKIAAMRSFSVKEILNYLQASHNFYLTKKLPEIEQSIHQIFSKYAQSNQLLVALVYFFNNYKDHLIEHIKMEEKVFFPYVKKLLKAKDGKYSADEINDILSADEVNVFKEAHDPVEDELKKISEIVREFTQDKELPLPFRVFLNQVEIFEIDLRKHAIIEDYVLLPMVKELEKELTEL